MNDPASANGAAFDAVLALTDDAVVTTDATGVVLTWNRGATALFGYSADEMRGRSLATIVPRGQQSVFDLFADRIQAGERVDHYETVRQTKDGRLLDVSVSLAATTNVSGAITGLVLVARDITLRRRAEAARRTSELRWQSIVESAVDGVIVIGAAGRIEAFNPAAERLFGYKEAEVVGRNVKMLMPSPFRDEHDGYLAAYHATAKAKIIGVGREVNGLRRDGTRFPLHLSVGEVTVDGERKFTGILHDLTDRVELEARLRASEARWRAVIESAVDGIVVIDSRGRVEAFNPAAERLFGYTEEEVVGRNVSVLMPAPYCDEHDGYLAAYHATGHAKIIGIGREVTGLRKDGTTFPLHLSVGEMQLGGDRKFTGILHDLTARVGMEERIREQAALARLGEMAAVIAHEVKNPLAGVRGAIQVIGRAMARDDKHVPIVAEIIARVDALSELLEDLLLFARPPKPKPMPVDVGPLVATTAELLTADPTVSDVHVEVEGVVPSILADPNLLKIVFHNLLINGAHAMGGRGQIRVSLRVSDQACVLSFQDYGPGIPAEMREQIFTPFFTTKARGTGLGLPTARRLVEAHHGTISVICPPEGGTTVRVELPLQKTASPAVAG